MYDVMQGIRVIEVAEHTFVPAAGMVMADWGAEVIKVERAGLGDPSRTMAGPFASGCINVLFEAANRGKKSVGIDLRQAAGREQLHRLIDSADVFITSLRADARARLGIETSVLMTRHPRLIYGRGTGYGARGPLASAGGFDFPSAWCRSGAAYIQTAPDGEPPQQPGSIGDLAGGVTLAGAIAAALFRRERSGQGCVVDNSLYAVGTWIMGQSVIAANSGDQRARGPRREQAYNALNNLYRTRDGRWISLCLLMPEWWPDLATHLGCEGLLTDGRFATAAARTENRLALIHELDAIFAQRDYADWVARLHTLQGVWAPVQSPLEVVEDEQALVNGFVTPVTTPDGASYLAAASPGQFDEAPVGRLRASPTFAADTDAVLASIGASPETIARLRAAAVIT